MLVHLNTIEDHSLLSRKENVVTLGYIKSSEVILTTYPSGSRSVGKVISGICDFVCVCF